MICLSSGVVWAATAVLAADCVLIASRVITDEQAVPTGMLRLMEVGMFPRASPLLPCVPHEAKEVGLCGGPRELKSSQGRIMLPLWAHAQFQR